MPQHGHLLDSLNAICPYYTMYPLSFPKRVLCNTKHRYKWVFDPFCGRGTTNFAARLSGVPSIGFDSSPIAIAIASAKLANSTARNISRATQVILRRVRTPSDVPTGEFWRYAYHPKTLEHICRLREGLLKHCNSDEDILLRALILGALHGPLTKGNPSHLSNQCPRTFAPKPNYSIRFWKKHGLHPNYVDIMQLVTRRAQRYLSYSPPNAGGHVLLCDSRERQAFDFQRPVDLIITSPPYYGMRTYIPDQWIRNWFIGGPSTIDYSHSRAELSHQSPDEFSKQLRAVWDNCATVASNGCRLIIRYGAINDRKHDPLSLIKRSLASTNWKIVTIHPAGNASTGKRQAAQFGQRVSTHPRLEYDIYARLI